MTSRPKLHSSEWANLLRGESLDTAPGGFRIPIRFKITLPYFFLALVLAIGVAFLVTRIVFDTVEERFTNQLIEAGKLSAEWMVREEERMLESLRLLANTDGVPEALQNGDAEALRQLTFGVVVNNQEEVVDFLSPQGDLLLSMRHRSGGNLEAYDFARGGTNEYREWAFVDKVLRGVEDGQGDKFSGYVSADWGEFFYISGPVYQTDGSLAGVVLVGKTLPRLLSELQGETRIQVTIYDLDGAIIASTFFAPQGLSPEAAAGILNGQDTASGRRGLDSQRGITVSNIEYEEILAPWEARADEDHGILGSALSKTFLVSATNLTRLQIFALIAVSFLLVVLVGVNIANFITRPLMGLVDASAKVAQGDLGVQVDVRSRDEIETLTSSFNRMVKDLQRSQADMINAYDSALAGWAKALEMRDQITEGHTQRVVNLTLRIAREFGIQGAELEHIRRGALLHDIGKMGIPDSILQKEGPLDDEEWKVMKKHPEYAYDLLSGIEFLEPALGIPYAHHEKWDGSGYPRGLQGEEIPLEARIFAIVDVYDAITNDRPYRKAMPINQALEILEKGRGSHFEPQVVEAFFRVINRESA